MLWAYYTTPQRSTGETPYSLAYGVEVVISIEISLCSTRTLEFSPVMNEEAMVRQLDSLKECQEALTICLANYQQKLAQRYNKDVKMREFGASDLVLRRAVGGARDISAEKLTSN